METKHPMQDFTVQQDPEAVECNALPGDEAIGKMEGLQTCAG
jgi:hypothetical protein